MNKIVLGTLFSAMAVLTACDLDKYPETNISTETAWQTIDDATRFETGLYSFLQTINGGLYIYAADYQSDLFNATYSFSNRGGDLHRWDFTSSQYDIEDIYKNNYFCITNCNNIINNIDNIALESEDEQQKAKNIKGTAYLIRALCYHTLAVRFAKDYEPETASSDLGLPLVLDVDPNAKPSRSSLADTYKQIKSDITEARKLMTTEGASNSIYLTTDVIDALEARVDLYMHNYAEAVTISESLINKYPLSTTKDNLSKVFLNDEGSEIIYKVFLSVDERTNELPYYLYWYTSINNYSPDFVPSQWVIDLYEDHDIRKDTYFLRTKVVCGDKSADNIYMLNKYPGNPDLKTTTYEYYNMPKLFRSAEFYLIAAEASYKEGNEPAALGYLNDLRTQRGASSLNNKSGDELFKSIKEEWIREYIGEGMRLNDLKRWHDGFQRHDPQDLNILSIGTGMESLNISSENQKFVWEIPANDQNANSNLSPNWN